MAVSREEIILLVQLVNEEHGEKAMPHVDAYINLLRQSGDQESASLWSKVLAMLSHESPPKFG